MQGTPPSRSTATVRPRPSPGEKRRYKCQTCGRRFTTKQTMETHMLIHNGHWMCHTCGKTFATKTVLKNHLVTHTGERDYKCEHCGKAYRQSYSLTVHLLSHKGEKPHRCGVCSKLFRTGSQLERHQHKMHKGETRNIFLCETCGQTFGFMKDLKIHQQTHTVKEPCKCDTCGN